VPAPGGAGEAGGVGELGAAVTARQSRRGSGSSITLLIDTPPEERFHAATIAAIDHASKRLNLPVVVRVVPTDTIDRALIEDPGAAVVVGPGSPYRNPDGALEVIRSAREKGIPLVGT
jgi:CTP synthase (UTP-ammonia lyase)